MYYFKYCKKCAKETKFYRSENGKNSGNGCVECKKRRTYKDRIKHPFLWFCSQTISRHKISGYTVLFNARELFNKLKDITDCYLCGLPIVFETEKRINKKSGPSLDRIDNDTVLTLDNVKLVHWSCNTHKQNKTLKEFVEFCRSVASRFIDLK